MEVFFFLLILVYSFTVEVHARMTAENKVTMVKTRVTLSPFTNIYIWLNAEPCFSVCHPHMDCVF